LGAHFCRWDRKKYCVCDLGHIGLLKVELISIPTRDLAALRCPTAEGKVMQREQGYYWVTWGTLADPDTVHRLPGPRLGWWDGEAWWFVRIDRYYFDSEVMVLGERLAAPALAPMRAAIGA
jgi:hypothetical protein